jgi:hypothetical protein
VHLILQFIRAPNIRNLSVHQLSVIYHYTEYLEIIRTSKDDTNAADWVKSNKIL